VTSIKLKPFTFINQLVPHYIRRPIAAVEDDSDDEKPAAKKAAVKAVAKKAPVESSDDDSSEDEKPVAKKVVVAKKAAPAESSDSSDESEDEAPAKKAPVKAAAAKKPVSESSSDEESSEDEAPPAKVATPAAKKAAPTPVAPVVYDSASTTIGLHKIYVKGLPWLASEAEVRDFFKSCGKISSVELPMGDDGRSTGTAFVIFAERSELDAAIALDGQLWPGTERWLKIQEGFEKPERKSFGTGVRPEGCDTVFVGNLPFDVEEDQLREVFAEAGTVDRIRFATAEDGSFKGFAHVQFSDGACTVEAVKMAGTDINGRAIRVDYAPPRDRQSVGGGASGGRGGRGDGGRGGRGGRDGGRGGRGGRGTPGPPNKAKGSIAVSSGKKMTFDE
jgi:nucleolin